MDFLTVIGLACKDRNSEITRLSISAQSARGFDVLLAVLDHKIKSISEGRQLFIRADVV